MAKQGQKETKKLDIKYYTENTILQHTVEWQEKLKIQYIRPEHSKSNQMHKGLPHKTNFLFVTDLYGFRNVFFEVIP
jgi:hypothetical protein